LEVIDCLEPEAALMSKTNRATRDIFSSLFLFVSAVFIAIESCRLGLGKWNNPGAGYFPLLAAVLLGAISISIFIKGLYKRPVKEPPVPGAEEAKPKNVALVLGGMIAYTLIFDKAGFILTTFFLIAFFLRIVFPQRWLVTLSTAFCCAVGSYLLFKVLLGADLPKGIFGF
jgi:hypothetical protein